MERNWLLVTLRSYMETIFILRYSRGLVRLSHFLLFSYISPHVSFYPSLLWSSLVSSYISNILSIPHITSILCFDLLQSLGIGTAPTDLHLLKFLHLSLNTFLSFLFWCCFLGGVSSQSHFRLLDFRLLLLHLSLTILVLFSLIPLLQHAKPLHP